jgi:hypothetical protein
VSSSFGKFQEAARFRHFLWRQHPGAVLNEHLPEVVASDGYTVRRIVSRDHRVDFQVHDDPIMAASIVREIESSVGVGGAMLGYAMYSEGDTVAILRTGTDDHPSWLAIPHSHVRRMESSFRTLPLRLPDIPKARLIGGVTLTPTGQGAEVRAALEQRGSTFFSSRFAFDLLRHIRSWELHATVERNGVTERIRLLRDPVLIKHRVDWQRIEAFSVTDEWIHREYAQDPTLKMWFVVQFDTALFSLPQQWLRFWLQAAVTQ